MDDIYMLADTIIFNRIGGNLKAARLKQNITRQNLADAADISLFSLKKIEKGEIGSFNSLLRVLRTLGKFDVFQPLVDEEQLSPSEYYELVHSIKTKHQRKRASKQIPPKSINLLCSSNHDKCRYSQYDAWITMEQYYYRIESQKQL